MHAVTGISWGEIVVINAISFAHRSKVRFYVLFSLQWSMVMHIIGESYAN